MQAQSPADWAGRDLADMLGITSRNMLTQLGQWTRTGFLTRTGKGRYALPQPPPQATAPASP
jgi:hypothetical protein